MRAAGLLVAVASGRVGTMPRAAVRIVAGRAAVEFTNCRTLADSSVQGRGRVIRVPLDSASPARLIAVTVKHHRAGPERRGDTLPPDVPPAA